MCTFEFENSNNTFEKRFKDFHSSNQSAPNGMPIVVLVKGLIGKGNVGETVY